MRILELALAPVFEVPFLNAGRSQGDYYEDRLPIHIGRVDRLPQGVKALVATSDLQGRESFRTSTTDSLRLLGEVVPQILSHFLSSNFDLSGNKVGVLLAGDFYTVPALDKRGGSGDVTSVWNAFGEQFAWVAGVAGNHDIFGDNSTSPPRFQSPLYFLDEGSIEIDGLSIAGISGIAGNPIKLWRKTEEAFEHFIEDLAYCEPGILLMHDGPDVPELGLKGSPRIRQALMRLGKPLVVRGHAHWNQPLAELANNLQILNVDARVVILLEKD